MEPSVLKKIVWAIDVMEPSEFQKNARHILGALNREASAEIHPVYVIEFPNAAAGEPSTYEEAYIALAEKRLKSLPADTDNPGMKAGKVLVNRTARMRESVDLVTEFAHEIDADAILVSTHSRGTFNRMLMGSFAETLLLTSEFPVITVNPQTAVRESISKVLFPTTFGEEFRAGFQKAVRLCALFDASMTLLYKQPFIPMVGTFPEYYKVIDQENQKRKVEADIWRAWAKNLNVPVEIRMDTVAGNVADEIESYANQNAFDLIVMVSETLESDVARVGSICRKVVRSAECPVWTMKTDFYDEEDLL